MNFRIIQFVMGLLLFGSSPFVMAQTKTATPGAPPVTSNQQQPVVLNPADLPAMASPIDAKQEEFKEKARKRLYPGGADEEDLRVQADLPKPDKKAQDANSPGATPQLENEGF